jgi:hypothetical protein
MGRLLRRGPGGNARCVIRPPVALTEDFGDREPVVGVSGGVCLLATRLKRREGCANNRLDRRAVLIEGQQ